MKLKHILRLQYGSSLSAEVRQEGSIPVYGSNGPVGFHDKSNMLSPAIVVGRKGSHGKVVWAENGGFCIDTAFFVDHRSSFTNLRFAYYLLQTLGLDEPSKDSAVPGLDRSEAYNKYVPRLSLETQKAIADFLDRETARINQLIEKKQRLVELLGERNQSLIDDAITVDGPFTKLGHHIRILPGYAFASADFSSDPGDIRLLRGANIAPGRIKWDDVVYWPRGATKGLERFALTAGDVVLGMDRPWIASGIRIAELTAKDTPSLLLQRVCRIDPLSSLDKQFMKLLLSSKRFLAYFEPVLTGVSVPHISGDQVAGFRFSYLSVAKQQERASRCHSLIYQNGEIVARAEESISRLQEFRSALVTAAVTGQIDAAKWGKHGTTDRQLDAIESNMAVAAQPERQQARA